MSCRSALKPDELDYEIIFDLGMLKHLLRVFSFCK